MNNRQNQICVSYARGVALALASMIAFSCDQPQIAVEPDRSAGQIFVISHNADSVSVPGGDLRGKSLVSDSALEITYGRFEYVTAPNFLIEVFSVTLTHKLQGDTTLDYGTVTLSGRQLYETMTGQTLAGPAYDNRSILVNLNNENAFSWSSSYRLNGSLSFSATNSPYIKDFSQEIPAQAPNWIVSPLTGQTVSTASDLEISFRRGLLEGSTITIGRLGSGSYYHFKILRSATRVTIPAKYMQMVKDTLADAQYQIAFEEHLNIGTLTSQNKISGAQYQIPILENSIGGIVIKLAD